jgi:hypothetical protein
MIGRLRIELLAPERYGVVFIPYQGGGALNRREFTGRAALERHLAALEIPPADIEAGLKRLDEMGLHGFENFELNATP